MTLKEVAEMTGEKMPGTKEEQEELVKKAMKRLAQQVRRLMEQEQPLTLQD